MEHQMIEVKDKGMRAEDLLSVDERKARFVRQGEIYRIGVVRAKAQVLHEAQPQALFHTAVDHAAAAMRSKVDTLLTPAGFSVGALLPYAMPLLRMLRNRRFGNKSKIALGVVALLGGVGVYIQQKRRREAGY
ncbi:hypothetical protein [Massilia sp. DWR3-1-1]|uniref:hypothetical protein n=1 Tax=Massilia sp. DWR3-1-1 TaxID=2804559 RepID=UPI003CF09DBE